MIPSATAQLRLASASTQLAYAADQMAEGAVRVAGQADTVATASEEMAATSNDIADLLRERLAQDAALQAILISSDFLAKAPPHAVELICRELGIGHLVSGQCHGTGQRASLYIELTDTRDWHIRWARFFRGTAHTLLAESGAEMGQLVANLRRELVEQRRR